MNEKLEEAKSYLKELLRQYNFKIANENRQKAASLQSALMRCRGKLEICQKDFNRVIRTQAKNIQKGKSEGVDTIIQEQMLWDAAIGYLLIRDAVFALKTIASYDSISNAYEMLAEATGQMQGKTSIFSKIQRRSKTKERNAYGYITSATALKNKESMLENFFDQLKISGDIEACIASAKNPAFRQAEARSAYTEDAKEQPESALDSYMKRLNAAEDGEKQEESGDINDLMDINPPDSLL